MVTVPVATVITETRPFARWVAIGEVPTTAPRADPVKAAPRMPGTTPMPSTRLTLRRISLLP
jgi:hypothetical protein